MNELNNVRSDGGSEDCGEGERARGRAIEAPHVDGCWMKRNTSEVVDVNEMVSSSRDTNRSSMTPVQHPKVER